MLILVSRVNGSISIPAFASLVVIPVGITSSTAAIKVCVTNAGIKKYKAIIKKKKKKHDKIVFLAKTKFNKIEVLFCKALIDSSISYDEFMSVNNVLK